MTFFYATDSLGYDTVTMNFATGAKETMGYEVEDMGGDYKELVEQAKTRDPSAFTMLYEMIYKDLYWFALYTLKNREDAEDVVSDTVVDAYASIDKLRDSSAFRGWIFKILSNKCKRKLREYVHKTVELREESVHVSRDMAEDVQVRQAFYRLSDEERMIVAMKVFGGYQSKEIGVMLHKSHNTIRSKLSRALKKMEQFMES